MSKEEIIARLKSSKRNFVCNKCGCKLVNQTSLYCNCGGNIVPLEDTQGEGGHEGN